MTVNKGDSFKPGQTCEKSGVYRVMHDRNHVHQHEVTMVYGHTFPPCRGCGAEVRFVLVYAAQHLLQNEHFKKQ